MITITGKISEVTIQGNLAVVDIWVGQGKHKLAVIDSAICKNISQILDENNGIIHGLMVVCIVKTNHIRTHVLEIITARENNSFDYRTKLL